MPIINPSDFSSSNSSGPESAMLRPDDEVPTESECVVDNYAFLKSGD